MYFKDIHNRLKSLKLYLNFVGTPEHEIVNLENKMGIRFPSAFKEFLIIMGDKQSPLFVGSDSGFSKIEVNREIALQLLRECDSALSLPKDSLVIQSHQGTMFWFIMLGKGENPPVYGFNEMETQDEFDLISPSFTDFVYNHIDMVSSLPPEVIEQLI